jgi:hypothetical protein
MGSCWQDLGANHFFLGSWGDQGDIGESSAHPTLLGDLTNLGSVERRSMASNVQNKGLKIEEVSRSEDEHRNLKRNPTGLGFPGAGTLLDEGKN